MDEIKRSVLDAARDAARNFSYYGRKECESLSLEDLNDALASGVVTIVDIVLAFADELKDWGGLSDAKVEGRAIPDDVMEAVGEIQELAGKGGDS